MRKYIDADELKKVFRDEEDAEYARWTLAGVIGEIDDIEAADVQEVRHGHWKGINRNKYNDDEATCSVCGVTFSSGYSDPSWWDYCPNCGAKMDE